MKKIGEGFTGIVYSDGEFAYKKYHKDYSLDNMKFEVKVQNEIYNQTSLNVAKYEIVDDYIKMTLFEGKNLAYRLIHEDYVEGFQEFIDLQLNIFEYKNLHLADSYVVFKHQIENTDADEILKSNALKSLDSIERLYHLCHFDFHPENIMYHQNVPFIIDWTNAKLGNPVMDVASTYIIFKLFAEEYADMYLRVMIEKGFSIKEVIDAIPLMAFIRFRETKEERLVLILKNLIKKQDFVFKS